jgi:hypothetical protein
VSRIASDFQKGVGTGAEQEIVEDLLVLQDQRRQAAGECEHYVQVAGREKFPTTLFDPLFPSSDLTLWAVAIAATVIRNGGTMPATGALVDMTTECCGTTPRNGQQHFDVLPTEPMAGSFYESISRGADDVGHLQRRPAHLLLAWWLVVQC